MKLHLVSDLHLEYYPDDSLAYDLEPEDCEALVIAGDFCTRWYGGVYDFFQVVGEKYQYVIYILGNHEYYGSSYEEAQGWFRSLEERHSNLFCLENQTLSLGTGGPVVAGTTLWFRDTPMNPLYEGRMRDFQQIQGFRSWVYEKNQEAVDFLENVNWPGRKADLVITHHLPSYKSVSPRYAEDPTNLYFLCDVSEIMLDTKPKVWVHGHTHTPCDYQLGDTRVICNARGYPWESGSSYRPLVIEI